MEVPVNEPVNEIDEKHLEYYPCINMEAAARFFGCVPELFERRFRLTLHKKIRSVITNENGLERELLLLVDVIRAAFPEANNVAVHTMALKSVGGGYQYTGLVRSLEKIAEYRKQTRELAKDARRDAYQQKGR